MARRDRAATQDAAATRRKRCSGQSGCSGCHGGERRRSRAGPRRPLRQAGAAAEREHGARRRALSARLDPVPRKEVAAGYEPIMPSFAGRDQRREICSIASSTSIGARRPMRADTQHDEHGRDELSRPPAIDAAHRGSRRTDHKRIAILYMISITLFFFVGGAAATLFRARADDARRATLCSAETYNKLFTLHGVIMVLFFLIPSIPGGARQLPRADDDRRARPRVSAAEPAELVSVHGRRHVHDLRR